MRHVLRHHICRVLNLSQGSAISSSKFRTPPYFQKLTKSSTTPANFLILPKAHSGLSSATTNSTRVNAHTSSHLPNPAYRIFPHLQPHSPFLIQHAINNLSPRPFLIWHVVSIVRGRFAAAFESSTACKPCASLSVRELAYAAATGNNHIPPYSAGMTLLLHSNLDLRLRQYMPQWFYLGAWES